MISRVLKKGFINNNNNIDKNLKLFINRSYCSGSQNNNNNNNGISTEINDLPIYFHRDLQSNKDIFMIGSVHTSRDSATQVQKFIRDVKPDALVLELDDSRFNKIRNDIHNKDLSTYKTQSNEDDSFLQMLFGNLFGGQSSPFAGVLIKNFKKFQNTMKTFGLIPGLEFYFAIKEAENLGCEIILGDVDSNITINKLLHAAPSEFFSKSNGISPDMERLNQLMSPLVHIMMKDGATEKEIEVEYKRILNNKTLNEVRSIFEKELPKTYEALCIGRERHITRSIKQSKANTIVVVVGALHVDGIKKLLNLPLNDIPKSLPPPPKSSIQGLLGAFGLGGGGSGGINGGFGNMMKGLLGNNNNK
ncbi:hypothetical protein DDB_G0287043 [Dictyostelium discoideum AX4]|uniref:TraB domain-containing protein n=1 Tax=Dictyostelium discoideum TaxID=44689 RepID=Q54KY0_DICDI|nr:hypothetical protein DDB_G0287043 [Dictyostelium discoideum AX4]EAL63886.1 hypothetical protein DDB_G0287043 [Dictyostelium discoideum AX4]|eukprot:XP_637390.1 hypothetical protein DDB_G0287043 [Dictyostelium discoideum AX4]